MIEPTNGLRLADPNFNEPSEIDIILGAELYESLRLPGVELNGVAVFTNTVFGYVASGTVADNQVSHVAVNFNRAHDNELKRYWEIEEVPRKHKLSPDNNWSNNTSTTQLNASQMVASWWIYLGPIRPCHWVNHFHKQRQDLKLDTRI